MKTPATLLMLFFLLGNVNAQKEKSSTPVADSAAAKSKAQANKIKNDEGFTRLDRPATFPGGAKGWLQFLKENIDPGVGISEDLDPGKYLVYAKFLVDTNGFVNNVNVFEKIGRCHHCVLDVQKLFKKSPKWIPAFQNGHNVKYLATQTITYIVPNNNTPVVF